MEFETVVGLEVHAQLKTNTKIFCGCSTEFGGAPNTQVCPVCLGMPGMLPVLNEKAVAFAIRVGLATHCTIARESRFARKNYFYPDLPKGYQISQYELPIASKGYIDITIDGIERRIGINRIHMEEDAGKLIHAIDSPVSQVDYNRTGVPLIEIVSEPDLRTPEEAGAYLRQLRSIVRYLGICDGNMEEGSFRCDANVSIRAIGSKLLGTRTEVKNLNSFKNIEKALHYEVARQIDVLAEGGSVTQETRLWDPEKNRTFSMRGKEEAHDYRYFSDPDLLPLIMDESYVASVQKELPELPVEKKSRFISAYGLPSYDAEFLASSREMADYFEDCVKLYSDAKTVSNWIMGALVAFLNSEGKSIEVSPVSVENLAQLLSLIQQEIISGKIAKAVFEEMARTGESPQEIVEKKGLVQVQDSEAIETIVEKVIEENPVEVEAYRNGKKKLIGFFVGRIMQETGGKANPKVVNEVLSRKLGRQ